MLLIHEPFFVFYLNTELCLLFSHHKTKNRFLSTCVSYLKLDKNPTRRIVCVYTHNKIIMLHTNIYTFMPCQEKRNNKIKYKGKDRQAQTTFITVRQKQRQGTAHTHTQYLI